jgi:hypothetical protein
MKYIAFIKSLYFYIKNSFISSLSFVIIKFIPQKNIFEIIHSLKNKKVLVLGTGPSLNKLNQDLINNYEVIIFLNHAISVAKIFNFNNKKKIFFNGDLFRYKEIKKDHFFDKTWMYIFIPIHLQFFFILISLYFKKNIFLLIPIYRLGSPFEKNVTKSIITYTLAQNGDTKKNLDVNNFRSFPHSVALNTFYFLISCKVNQVHYLGCDFSMGRSAFTNYKASDFSKKKIYLWINKFKKLSKKNSVDFKDLK